MGFPNPKRIPAIHDLIPTGRTNRGIGILTIRIVENQPPGGLYKAHMLNWHMLPSRIQERLLQTLHITP